MAKISGRAPSLTPQYSCGRKRGHSYKGKAKEAWSDVSRRSEGASTGYPGASVLLLFSLTDVAAQRALFTVLTPEQTGGLTSAQTNRLRSVEASRNAGDVKVVRMGLTALRDDTLRLTLSGRSVPAMRQKTLVRSPSDFTWVGQLPTGAAILVVRNGQVTGSIQNGTEIYEITPLGGGAHAIVEVDHTGFPYTVTLSGKPGAGGALDGAGSFPAGALHTVTAAPNGGYTFVSWTEGKKVVSDQPSFSFKVTGNRKLVANFLRSGGGGQEDGGLAIQQHWLSARQTRSRWTTPLGRLSKKQQGGGLLPTLLQHSTARSAGRSRFRTIVSERVCPRS